MPDFRFWRWKNDHDDDVNREIDVHLALEVEEQVDAGTSGGPAESSRRPAHQLELVAV